MVVNSRGSFHHKVEVYCEVTECLMGNTIGTPSIISEEHHLQVLLGLCSSAFDVFILNLSYYAVLPDSVSLDAGERRALVTSYTQAKLQE